MNNPHKLARYTKLLKNAKHIKYYKCDTYDTRGKLFFINEYIKTEHGVKIEKLNKMSSSEIYDMLGKNIESFTFEINGQTPLPKIENILNFNKFKKIKNITIQNTGIYGFGDFEVPELILKNLTTFRIPEYVTIADDYFSYLIRNLINVKNICISTVFNYKFIEYEVNVKNVNVAVVYKNNLIDYEVNEKIILRLIQIYKNINARKIQRMAKKYLYHPDSKFVKERGTDYFKSRATITS